MLVSLMSLTPLTSMLSGSRPEGRNPPGTRKPTFNCPASRVIDKTSASMPPIDAMTLGSEAVPSPVSDNVTTDVRSAGASSELAVPSWFRITPTSAGALARTSAEATASGPISSATITSVKPSVVADGTINVMRCGSTERISALFGPKRTWTPFSGRRSSAST